MLRGPILRRELLIAARRAETYVGRFVGGATVAVVIAACVFGWDYWGWDRTSVAGAKAFGLAVFGLLVGALLVPTIGLIPSVAAPGIAGERDRKSLDALLATRLSSADIVLGVMVSALLRCAAGVTVMLPVVVLAVYWGGIDVRWVLLAALGVASTALVLAALSIAVSVSTRTARRAIAITMLLIALWFFVPFFLVGVFARGWPSAVLWARPALLWVLDSNPLVVVLNLAGLVARVPLPVAVLRMVALQLAAAAGLTLWAIGRLRPASRALYDVEGRTGLLRALRRTRHRRPPCGDDPILWHEMHPLPRATRLELLLGHVIHAVWAAGFVVTTLLFAVPAFSELIERGYGPSPEAMKPPELHPAGHLLVKTMTAYGAAAAPGQARLEFNIVLRQGSAILGFFFVLFVAGAATEGIAGERERDTWLALLATPLTGREILRAKMLGAVWRARECIAWMVGLWLVGLLAGAVHPLGFVAGLAQLAVSAWFFAAAGTSASLWARRRAQAVDRGVAPALLLCMSAALLFFLPQGMGSVLLSAGSMPFRTWASLVSYEDVRAALESGTFPQLASSPIKTGEGAGMVLATCLLGTLAELVGAFLLTRAMFRGFDRAAGRPCRAEASNPIAV